MYITFVVSGKPQGKGRPKFTRQNGKTYAYTPETTRAYEELVRLNYWEQCGGRKLDGAVKATIKAYFEPPKSANKTLKHSMLTGMTEPAVKPDADNIIKSVLDALNGVAYKDDAQITEVTCIKQYAETARVEVVLRNEI